MSQTLQTQIIPQLYNQKIIIIKFFKKIPKFSSRARGKHYLVLFLVNEVFDLNSKRSELSSLKSQWSQIQPGPTYTRQIQSQIPPIPLENLATHDHIARGRELLHGNSGHTTPPLTLTKDLTLAMTSNPMSPSPLAI